MPPFRFIQVGTGGMGRSWCEHALGPNIRDGLIEPVAAVDIVPEVLVHARDGLGLPAARCYTDLERAFAFAPLHGPPALALIAAAQRRYPDRPHVACFDTGFHEHLPPIASVLPLPKALRAEGVRRYGFHGLSCQSIARQLGADATLAANLIAIQTVIASATIAIGFWLASQLVI